MFMWGGGVGGGLNLDCPSWVVPTVVMSSTNSSLLNRNAIGNCECKSKFANTILGYIFSRSLTSLGVYPLKVFSLSLRIEVISPPPATPPIYLRPWLGSRSLATGCFVLYVLGSDVIADMT